MTKKQKNVQEENQINKKEVIIRSIFIIIFFLLLIMTTYAWFSSQKDITIGNLRGSVEVSESMEVSLDAKTWYHKIDLSKEEDGKTPLKLAVQSRNAAYGVHH